VSSQELGKLLIHTFRLIDVTGAGLDLDQVDRILNAVLDNWSASGILNRSPPIRKSSAVSTPAAKPASSAANRSRFQLSGR